MPSVPIPSGSTWELFPALAVLVLVILVLVGVTIGVWREYKLWAKEKEAREMAERKNQREWQAAQDEKRDKAWQGTVLELQDRYTRESKESRDKLSDLAEVIEQLVRSVEGLRGDFNEHIIEDTARFNILFNDNQKNHVPAEIQAVKKRKTRSGDASESV